MKRRALVTGHLGFVGSAMAAALEREGWEIQGCDIAEPRPFDCRELFNARPDRVVVYPVEMIVHCAAVVGGRETISNDPLAVAENLAIDSDMFRWAARGNAKRVVYFSSAAAYPTHLQHQGRFLAENDIAIPGGAVGVPDLTYGWAKLTGEVLADYARAEHVDVHVLRPFSGYGETQDPNYPFPAFIDRALRREDPFEVWGDGQVTRDFVHIDDIVGTVLAVIEQDYQEPLNIGTSLPTKFDDLAKLVTMYAGYTPELKHREEQPTGPRWRVADTTRMREVYTPKVTLDEGVRRALAAR